MRLALIEINAGAVHLVEGRTGLTVFRAWDQGSMSMGIRRIGGALLGIGIAIAALGPAKAQVQHDVETVAARLDALAEGFMTTDQVPGAIAAVVAGDEVILRGWGSVDLEAGTAAGPDDVRFEIGSISKLFTWTAVMMLVEEGELDLQADVSGLSERDRGARRRAADHGAADEPPPRL
jgi:CubicO group peptidase (beta-lactamase class C family)